MDRTIDYYNTNAHAYIAGTQDVEFSELQGAFLELIPAGGYILDFGCGSGRDTKCFIGKGFRVDAIDGSEEMVKAATEYADIPVRQMLFQELTAVETYDGIWACSSILHLNVDQLEDVIGKIRTALKPGGIFYTSFKYGDFSGERNGRFFTDMTEQSFSDLIARMGGFEIIRMWITTDVRPGREDEKWLNALLRKNKALWLSSV